MEDQISPPPSITPPDMDSDSSLTELSSDLSSIGSLSPLPCYPSPNPSQDVDPTDDLSESSKKRKLLGDGEPIKKKRKRPEPKPRTTENLDLSPGATAGLTEQASQLDLLLKVLRKRRKIVVIAGAGISVSAGIPDFRSSTGLFKSLKSDHKLKASGKQLFDASVYQTDKSTGAFHDMVRNLSGLVSDAKPTAFHHMLATLGQEGRLLRLYTQNVDGIDTALPSLETHVPLPQKGPWPRTIQLHGGLEKMVCSKCRALSDFQPDLFDGPVPPACPSCIEADKIRTDYAGKRSHGVGRLRPRMVLYNEHNPDEDAIGAVMHADLRTRPDAIIVVGTSMKIPGVRRIVREMCGVVRGRRDGLTVWINQDGPPPGKEFEECWDLIVKGPCDEVARQWTLSMDPHRECTTSDIERVKGETMVEVVVDSPRKLKCEGIITPAASPMPKSMPTVRFIVRKPAELGVEQSAESIQQPKLKTVQADTTKPKRPRKKKKPKAIGQDDAPTSALATSHFKVSKPISTHNKLQQLTSTTPHSSISKDGGAGPTPSKSGKPVQNYIGPIKPVLFPNLVSTYPKQTPTTPNRSIDLSSSSPLTDLDSSVVGKFETPTSLKIETFQSPTPENIYGQSSDKLGTVSPTSVPRGMEALLS